jgi:predicted transcriptional regulator
MLTPLELDIMKAVWQRPSATVRDVQAALQPRRKLAYTSVLTTMNRLFMKGFLTRNLRARTHFYEPTVPFSDVREAALNGLIDNYFGGSRENLQEFLTSDVVSQPDAPLAVPEPLPLHPSSFDESLL